MKNRSLCLLLIFCINLVPIYPVQAQEMPAKSVYDSLALMYVNDAILLGEAELEEVFHSPGLLAPAANILHDEPDNAALAFALQAAKDLRNDLDANCSLLTAQYRQADKNCEADRIQSVCDKKRAEIDAEIGLLHKKRGDRRRPLTKFWHSIKRSGKSIWRRIGPVGRAFLRKVGPEALKIVASGGTLSTSVIKNLFKHTAKTMIRGRIKKMVYQGVQRLIGGQLEIAQAAGVDICDPDQEQQLVNPPEIKSDLPPGKRKWECEDIKEIIWKLSVQEGEDMKILKNELDFQIIYDESQEVIDIIYYIDVVQEWAVWQVDGSLGQWFEVTTERSMEGQATDITDNGYFEATLKGEEYRADTMLDAEMNLPANTNIYGLINPDDISMIYICEVGANKLPSYNESISPENFRDLCGTHLYYECKLNSKRSGFLDNRHKIRP